MPKTKLSSDWSIQFVDAWEVVPGELEPPRYLLVIFDVLDHGHTVRDFFLYPSHEEILAAISSFRREYK